MFVDSKGCILNLMFLLHTHKCEIKFSSCVLMVVEFQRKSVIFFLSFLFFFSLQVFLLQADVFILYVLIG